MQRDRAAAVQVWFISQWQVEPCNAPLLNSLLGMGNSYLACSTIRLKGTSQSFFELSRGPSRAEIRFLGSLSLFGLDFAARTCTILATTMKEEAPLILLLYVLPGFPMSFPGQTNQ